MIMIFKKWTVLIGGLIVLAALHCVPLRAKSSSQILVVVGNSAITSYQVQQRTLLNLMSSRDVAKRVNAQLKHKSTKDRFKKYMQKYRPQSKEEAVKLQKRFVAQLQREARNGVARGMKKKVLDELIDERLMIANAKKQNITISKALVDQRIVLIAKNNSKGGTPKEALTAFTKVLKSRGVNIETFRDKIKASMAWRQVINRKFGRETNFTDVDVEKELGFDTSTARDKKIQFKLVQIILTVPKKSNQETLVKQLVGAESIRARFSGCSNMKSLLAPYKGAKVVRLGNKTIDDIPAPMNLIIGGMKAGQTTPPQITDKGIEIYAVCDRRQVVIDSTQRNKVIGKLRQKALQMRAQRYLKNLRQEILIERKTSL